MPTAISGAPKRVTRAMSKAKEETTATSTTRAVAAKAVSKPPVKPLTKRKATEDGDGGDGGASKASRVARNQLTASTKSSTTATTTKSTRGRPPGPASNNRPAAPAAAPTAGRATRKTITKPPVPSRRVNARTALPLTKKTHVKVDAPQAKEPAQDRSLNMPATPRSAFKGSRARGASVSSSDSPSPLGSASPRKVHFSLAESKDEKENYFPLCKNRVRSKPKGVDVSKANSDDELCSASADKGRVAVLSPRKGVQVNESPTGALRKTPRKQSLLVSSTSATSSTPPPKGEASRGANGTSERDDKESTKPSDRNTSAGTLAQSPAKRPNLDMDAPPSPLKELLHSARKKLDHMTSKYVDINEPDAFKQSMLCMSPPKKFGHCTNKLEAARDDPFKESVLNMSPPKKFALHSPGQTASREKAGATMEARALFQSPAKRFASPIKFGHHPVESNVEGSNENGATLTASTATSGISGSPRKAGGMYSSQSVVANAPASPEHTTTEHVNAQTPPKQGPVSGSPMAGVVYDIQPASPTPSRSKIPVRIGSASPPSARSNKSIRNAQSKQSSSPTNLSADEDELQSDNEGFLLSPARSVKTYCEPTQFVDDPLVFAPGDATWDMDAPQFADLQHVHLVDGQDDHPAIDFDLIAEDNANSDTTHQQSPSMMASGRSLDDITLGFEPVMSPIAAVVDKATMLTTETEAATREVADGPLVQLQENTLEDDTVNDLMSLSPQKVALKPADDSGDTVIMAEEMPRTPEPEVSFTASISTNAATASDTPGPQLNPKLLDGVVAFVDVYTNEGADASGVFVELLEDLGAKCVKQWAWTPHGKNQPEKIGITHVVFKNGSVKTMEKVRAAKGLVNCVGVGWVLDCECNNKWLPEEDFAIDNTLIPRGGHRRRKSMEPRRLSNHSPMKEPVNFDSPRRRETMPLPSTPKQANTRPSLPAASIRRTPSRSLSLAPIEESPSAQDTVVLMRPTDSLVNSPATPYTTHRQAMVQQTCPPKQTGETLFPFKARVSDSPIRTKLAVTKRQSLQAGSLKIRRLS